MKLSDYVIDYIKQQGVKHIFMLPGGGSIHLVDSVRSQNMDFVINLHEQAASIAAEAYAQYTNNLGVCLVTTGPGGTNAITGCTAAWLDSIPMLFISGQVQRKNMKGKTYLRQKGFQEVNIVDIVKSITKVAVTVTDPASIKHTLDLAIHTAKTDRPGPVWLDIPLDVQSAEITPSSLPGFKANKPGYKIAISNKLLDALANAKRPALLVGNGVRLAHAEKELHDLINKLNIPILTTWSAADMIEEVHPLYFGRPGTIASRYANLIQQNADFILCIGARLDVGQTAHNIENFAPKAFRAVVDIDYEELQKLGEIDYTFHSDAKVFLKKLLHVCPKTGDTHEWFEQCKIWKNQYPIIQHDYYTDPVNLYVFIEELSRILPNDAIIVTGSSGACAEVTLQSFKIKKGQKLICSPGLGSMGFGISAALGACIASGKKQVICIEGDGSFAMNTQELQTIKSLNLPITIFVLNNDGYHSIRTTQNNYFNGKLIGCDDTSGLSLPSIEFMAKAYNFTYDTIDSHLHIRNAVKTIIHHRQPTIYEVMITKNHKTQPRVGVFKNEKGEFKSRPMEEIE